MGYKNLYEAVHLLQKAMDASFLESYIENGENILDNFQVRVFNQVPDDLTTQKLEKNYASLQELNLSTEEIQKITQLVLLKGSMEDKLQANHQLTPDSIGYLFVYLIQECLLEKKITVLDLSVGMGNLLLTVLSNLASSGYDVNGVGVDNDETLLEIASINNRWANRQDVFFYQDAIQPLLLDPVDAAIGDLPVGYYPRDEKVQSFQTRNFSKGEHTYAHHLLIEQSMKYVKESGWGFFLVPSHLFESPQKDFLLNWLQKEVYFQGFIHLPTNLFLTGSAQKSILLLQNRGGHAHQAREVLLAELTSLKDPKAIQNFFKQFKQWKIDNIQKIEK